MSAILNAAPARRSDSDGLWLQARHEGLICSRCSEPIELGDRYWRSVVVDQERAERVCGFCLKGTP